MSSLRSLLVIGSCFLSVALAWGQGGQNKSAQADLKPTQGNSAQGTITFQESGGKVRVTGTLTGAPAGKHGFHIHEKGDCSAPDAATAGGHFNPDQKSHGAPTAAEHHVGDMGNIEADANGNLNVDAAFDFLSLSGVNSIIGKALILHAGEDDLKTQPTGNAGARIACGVIQQK